MIVHHDCTSTEAIVQKMFVHADAWFIVLQYKVVFYSTLYCKKIIYTQFKAC